MAYKTAATAPRKSLRKESLKTFAAVPLPSKLLDYVIPL